MLELVSTIELVIKSDVLAVPSTSSLYEGDVVPIPTLPILDMKIVEVACAVPASSPTIKLPFVKDKDDGATPESESVPDAPPTREPSVPEYERPVPSERVVVATDLTADVPAP